MIKSEQASIQILVVEDDPEISRLLEIVLSQRGHFVSIARDGVEALDCIHSKNYNLILLDWMMPKMSGLDFIRELRKQNNLTPVIFITAKSQPQDIVSGLEAGADDYLTKPFNNSVLIARIDSVIRRSHFLTNKIEKSIQFSTLNYRSLSLNLDTFEVSLSGQSLHLTKSEFVILSELVKNCEKVLTRDQLVEKTQGDGVNVTSRTIDTHVFGLRKKLGEGADWIETIRGVGYRLVAE